jgi:polar amino acid transport system substrate-binding protein
MNMPVFARIVALLMVAAAFAATSANAAPDHLAQIKQKNLLVVGVKTDYPPFGNLGPDGSIVGLEPALAADLAQRLKVGLKLVAVTSANRLQKLQDGSVDVLIATLGDTQARRQLATLVQPNYYASGVNLMVPPDSHVHRWMDVRGLPVCATQGVYANRLMAERFLLDLKIFNTNRDSLLALKNGRCIGWMQDDTLIDGVLSGSEWAGYSMPLPSALPLPWSIALPASDQKSALETFVSNTIADWHRSKFLIQTAKSYHIHPSDFLGQMDLLWNQMDSTGHYLCTRQPNGDWPLACQNQALISSSEVSGLRQIGMLINERLGLNFTVVYDPYDRSLFLSALMHSAILIVGSILGGVFVGLYGALLICRRIPLVSNLLRGALTFCRMTPPLLQIYVIFFGIGSIAAARWGISVDATAVVIVCLSFYSGAANAFSLVDAADVLFSRVPDFRLTLDTLPRALYLARGPLIGSLVNAVKATGMASAIAVPEIISSSTSIIADRGNIGVMMNLLMMTYFLTVLGIVRLLTSLQNRLPTA